MAQSTILGRAGQDGQGDTAHAGSSGVGHGVLQLLPHRRTNTHPSCTPARADLRLAVTWLPQHPAPQPAGREGMAVERANPMGHGWGPGLGSLPGILAQAGQGKPQTGPSSSNSCMRPVLLGLQRLLLPWES